MSGIPKVVLEIIPFAFSIILGLGSFLQDGMMRSQIEKVIKENHPKKVDEEVVPGIANYAVDIFGRSNFLVSLLMVLIGSLVIGLDRQSSWYIIIAALIVCVILYISISIFWKEPIGKLTIGRTFWHTSANIMNLTLILANLGFIASLLFL
jgi:Na+-transporting NADH:ubiquinone oxidoreductase subunit NqrB